MSPRARNRTSPGGISRPSGRVRVVGGRYRGSILRFPAGAPVRPTPDRVRETLFNWLSPRIEGARCLDLFAGSGALSVEAASRGARSVVAVERDHTLAEALRDACERLGADNVEVIEGDALAWLASASGPFDVVFLDPPFGGDHLPAALALLAAPGRLGPGARVYVETAADAPALPPSWTTERTRRAGQVRYHLAAPAERGPVPDHGPAFRPD